MIYRKIDPRMWNDDKFLSLHPDTKMLWIYLLTGPHVLPLPGIFVAGVGTLSDGMRNRFETVSASLAELSRKGLVEVDAQRLVMRLPNACRYNPPDNPNVLKGWWKLWGALPECALKMRHVPAIQACLPPSNAMQAVWTTTFGTVDLTVPETVSEPFGDAFRKHEHEQQHEPEHDLSPSDADAPPVVSADGRSDTSPALAVDNKKDPTTPPAKQNAVWDAESGTKPVPPKSQVNSGGYAVEGGVDGFGRGDSITSPSIDSPSPIVKPQQGTLAGVTAPTHGEGRPDAANGALGASASKPARPRKAKAAKDPESPAHPLYAAGVEAIKVALTAAFPSVPFMWDSRRGKALNALLDRKFTPEQIGRSIRGNAADVKFGARLTVEQLLEPGRVETGLRAPVAAPVVDRYGKPDPTANRPAIPVHVPLPQRSPEEIARVKAEAAEADVLFRKAARA